MGEVASDEDVIAIIRPIWEDLLEQPVTDIDDDFFWLGGDSLLALNVAERVNSLGYSMPRVGLFHCPTLRLLARGLKDPRYFSGAPPEPSAEGGG